MKPKPLVTPPNPGPAAYLRFVALLLPVTANSSGWLEPGRWAAVPASRPYLAVLGPTPLHFAAAAAPPDPLPGPAAAVVKPSAETKPTVEGAGPGREVMPGQSEGANLPPAGAKDVRVVNDLPDVVLPKPPPAPKAIMRDEFSPNVRTEDLLPFFAFPPGRREGGMLTPGQIVPPPSSATYRQQ